MVGWNIRKNNLNDIKARLWITFLGEEKKKRLCLSSEAKKNKKKKMLMIYEGKSFKERFAFANIDVSGSLVNRHLMRFRYKTNALEQR
ncbi:hypothetical protein TNCV_2044961 [Trichonephila clavipes]|nr:hypothetical protein TNCV_2044961 [Trichonephila clavipes]